MSGVTIGAAPPSSLAGFVRRHDPDRFLTALFAASDRRETLLALYAFNHELARAWEVASQPTLTLIRLQWWREVVEGAGRQHEVAVPLQAQLSAGRLEIADLLALIEGRELVADGLATLVDWQRYLQATAGTLAGVAGRVLGAPADVRQRLSALGTAYGVAGQLRGRAAWGGEVLTPPEAELTAWGRELLGKPAPLGRSVLAAGLVGVLARRDLARPGVTPVRGLGDRLAVTRAAMRGVL